GRLVRVPEREGGPVRPSGQGDDRAGDLPGGTGRDRIRPGGLGRRPGDRPWRPEPPVRRVDRRGSRTRAGLGGPDPPRDDGRGRGGGPRGPAAVAGAGPEPPVTRAARGDTLRRRAGAQHPRVHEGVMRDMSEPSPVGNPPPSAPDRNLALELVRVTEAAALGAGRWVGQGDKESADQAAVDTMRLMLSTVTMD